MPPPWSSSLADLVRRYDHGGRCQGPGSLGHRWRAENEAFVKRVRALHLDAQIDLYTPGTHNWVYWQQELHKAWPLLTDGLHDG